MFNQNAVSTILTAALAAATLPAMPAFAQMKTSDEAKPVAVEAPAADESASESKAPTELVAPVSESFTLDDETSDVIAAPATEATASATPVAGPGFSLPSVKLPFSLSLSYRPETAALGGTGFAASGTPAMPTQFNYPTANGTGWSGTAEIGIPFITLGARTTSYGSLGNYGTHDTSSIAAGEPYYWPEGAWSAYVRALGLRFGYLSEQFNTATKHEGPVGSFVGGLDSGFSLFGLLGVDYHVLAGWGVSGQNVGNLKTSHVPMEGDASVYVNIGPVNLRAGYVARATFTGDPASFMTTFLDPASVAKDLATGDTTKIDTVNATRLGTYMGPYFGAGFTF